MSSENVTWPQDNAKFIGEHTLMVGDTTVTAANIVVFSGSRPKDLEAFRPSQVIHPALNEVLIKAFSSLMYPEWTSDEESGESQLGQGEVYCTITY